MFSMTHYKCEVRRWISDHPQASEEALTVFCEELIPPKDHPTFSWLVSQSVDWFHYQQSAARCEVAAKASPQTSHATTCKV